MQLPEGHQEETLPATKRETRERGNRNTEQQTALFSRARSRRRDCEIVIINRRHCRSFVGLREGRDVADSHLPLPFPPSAQPLTHLHSAGRGSQKDRHTHNPLRTKKKKEEKKKRTMRKKTRALEQEDSKKICCCCCCRSQGTCHH